MFGTSTGASMLTNEGCVFTFVIDPGSISSDDAEASRRSDMADCGRGRRGAALSVFATRSQNGTRLAWDAALPGR
eukprot:SAG11_NODE_2880_length_2875_cov_3.094020_3_plen_75_part_00